MKYYLYHHMYGAIRVLRGAGGWSCGVFDGYKKGIRDVTLYSSKKMAKIDLDSLTKTHTEDYKSNFSIKKI